VKIKPRGPEAALKRLQSERKKRGDTIEGRGINKKRRGCGKKPENTVWRRF